MFHLLPPHWVPLSKQWVWPLASHPFLCKEQRWSRMLGLQPAAWRGQGHHGQGVVFPLGCGSILAAVQRAATKGPYTGLHEAVNGTTDGPMGKTPRKTPTDLLRGGLPNPLVHHSHRRTNINPKTRIHHGLQRNMGQA